MAGSELELFETKEVITQDAFIKAAEANLGVAHDEATRPDDVANGGQNVIAALARVESGELTVEPPLSEGQKHSYYERAIALTETAGKVAISMTNGRRARNRLARDIRNSITLHPAAQVAKRSFRGVGSEVKS